MIRQNLAQVQSREETSQNIIRHQKLRLSRLHFSDVELLEVTLLPDWSAIVTVDGLSTWIENHRSILVQTRTVRSIQFHSDCRGFVFAQIFQTKHFQFAVDRYS